MEEGREYLNFAEVVDGVVEGKKYTREEWRSEQEYVFVKGDTLCITRREEGSIIPITHSFIVRVVDIEADDWYEVTA